MRWDVVHRTTYRYDAPVSDSYGVAHLVPRALPHQRVASWQVTVLPQPADRSEETDAFGNTVTYFQVTSPHRELLVEGRGTLEVTRPTYADDALATPWTQLRPLDLPGRPGAWQASEFALPSPLVDHVGVPGSPAQAHLYAATSLGEDGPVGEVVTDLMHRIHAEFDYDPTATTVTSTVDDTFDKRAGVCQDFAHLTLACLRSHGLAARYVSGYLATEPPPGKERVFGADASHAWVEVWLGGDAWLALDPTNDQWAGERYVTLAWGRDYRDVAPVRGVIFTEAKRSTLDVAVDVAPVPEASAV